MYLVGRTCGHCCNVFSKMYMHSQCSSVFINAFLQYNCIATYVLRDVFGQIDAVMRAVRFGGCVLDMSRGREHDAGRLQTAVRKSHLKVLLAFCDVTEGISLRFFW